MSEPTPQKPAASAGPRPMTPPAVRLAMPAEAWELAELQRRVWSGDQFESRMLDEVSVDEMAQVWHHAITRPPLAHFRILVATEGFGSAEPHEGGSRQRTRVCAFAAIGPSDDPDADATDSAVMEFAVDPLLAGQGHEDRLMHAVVDTMRTDGYERATWWLRSDQDDLRAWLTESGWAPDGAHREVGTEDGVLRVKQVRMHTDIRA